MFSKNIRETLPDYMQSFKWIKNYELNVQFYSNAIINMISLKLLHALTVFLIYIYKSKVVKHYV